MKILTLIISMLVMTSASIQALAGDPESALQPGRSAGSRIALEVAASLSGQQGQSQYYAAFLFREGNTFFGWPSYRVYELGGIIEAHCQGKCAYGTAGINYNIETPMAGISEQFTVFSTQYFSLEVGLGGYVKKPTATVGSVFTFGERVALISIIGDFELEAFYRHFSNGSFTSDNQGYDFFGISTSWRF